MHMQTQAKANGLDWHDIQEKAALLKSQDPSFTVPKQAAVEQTSGNRSRLTHAHTAFSVGLQCKGLSCQGPDVFLSSARLMSIGGECSVLVNCSN